jgi:hypothetical protein
MMMITVIKMTAFIMWATLLRPANSKTIVKGETVTELELLRLRGSSYLMSIPMINTVKQISLKENATILL